MADHDGDERGNDRLHIVIHADRCRADSLQRHRDEQVGEERRSEEDIEDRTQLLEIPNFPVEREVSAENSLAFTTSCMLNGSMRIVENRNIHFIIVTDE